MTNLKNVTIVFSTWYNNKHIKSKVFFVVCSIVLLWLYNKIKAFNLCYLYITVLIAF